MLSSHGAPALEAKAGFAFLGERRVMGHDDDNGPPPCLFVDQPDEAINRGRVEAGRRFVEEDQARGVNQGTREGDALTLSSGIRADRATSEGPEIKALRGGGEGFGGIDSVKAGGELDVFAPREVAVAEGVMANPPEGSSHFLARASERAVIYRPGAWTRKRSNEGQKRGFPRSVRPLDHGHQASLEAQADPDQGAHRSVCLAHPMQLDAGTHERTVAVPDRTRKFRLLE